MKNAIALGALSALLAAVQDPTATARRAGALLGAGQADKARAEARVCAEAGDPGCLLVLGRAALAKGDLAEASKALAAALPWAGDLRPHVAKLLGESLLLAGRAPDA